MYVCVCVYYIYKYYKLYLTCTSTLAYLYHILKSVKALNTNKAL